MNQKGFTDISFVIIILAAVIAVGGYFAMVGLQSVLEVPPAPLPTSITPATPTLTSTSEFDISTSLTSLTAGWKTYRNEKYGFEVKYPSEWKEDKELTSQVITEFRNPNSDTCAGQAEDFIRIIPTHFVSLPPHGVTTTFSGVDAFITDRENGICNTSRGIYLLSDLDLFIEQVAVSSESEKLEDQILSTFKFIPSPSGEGQVGPHE